VRIECPRCHTTYVDPSPAAAVESRDCPWCGHTTSAAPAQPLDLDELRRVWETLEPPPPRVEFLNVPDSTDAAVLINGRPAGRLTAAQFEELRRRLESP